jgi:catalase-peroxidase
VLLWQDPLPAVKAAALDTKAIAALKKKVLKSGLHPRELVLTAWASASTYRGSDRRGGANGARVRLAPQKDWAVNAPERLAAVLKKLEAIQSAFNATSKKKKLSLADLIVLAGCVGIEEAARKTGHRLQVPFTPGRVDATPEQTDAESFAVLELQADAFRNYARKGLEDHAEVYLIDRAQLLGLSAPEMTVLVGGMRALGANFDQSPHGVLTQKPGTLNNSFFVQLLDNALEWKPSSAPGIYDGYAEGKKRWTATRVDLVFGSNAELRAISEVYAQDGSGEKFVSDFVRAWVKIMEADLPRR